MNAAGITKHISFHCARHTFGSLQADAGTSIYAIQRMPGHKNVETTQIYVKTAPNVQPLGVVMPTGTEWIAFILSVIGRVSRFAMPFFSKLEIWVAFFRCALAENT